MKIFNKVAIIGVGLIGGSIGLELKKRHLCNYVSGVSFHRKSLVSAKKIGAIDLGSQNITIVKDADFVIFATPIKVMLKLGPQISKLIKKDCIVTDVGSTKEEIVTRLEEIFPNFVGSHPLAGSEKRGVLNAKSGLFKDSLVIMTPTKNSSPRALNKINTFWRALGARIAFARPHEHDKILGFISHLPHIAAFSLINSVPPKYLEFAASGFKDTTRIAASDSSLWADIFLSNRTNLLESINDFVKTINKLKSSIKSKNNSLLIKILDEARFRREKLE